MIQLEHQQSSGDGPFRAVLRIKPSSRVDLIDVRGRLAQEFGPSFTRFPKALYVSDHTTAGYLDQRLAERLEHDDENVQEFLQVFRKLFPPDAGYVHDKLHLRTELSEEQRASEPKNADSHLTFIGAGLKNCVSYEQGDEPVWFVELDGVHDAGTRSRRTTVVAYGGETEVARMTLDVEAPAHALDASDLRDPGLGLMDRLRKLAQAHGVSFGRLDVSLAPDERNAGLTVNEYETLLMTHDLREVLADPLRFMAERGRNALRDPRAIPAKTLNYAQFDAVQVLNTLLDRMGVRRSVVERIVNRALAVPVSHFLRMKRQISLPVLDVKGDGDSVIPRGTYQSPIMVQWRPAERSTRSLDVRLYRFA